MYGVGVLTKVARQPGKTWLMMIGAGSLVQPRLLFPGSHHHYGTTLLGIN